MLPVKYRQSVIKMAHDNGAGHMGVRKTYDVYCDIFHTCQVTGKPNQCITPAPLQPIPVISKPFDY